MVNYMKIQVMKSNVIQIGKQIILHKQQVIGSQVFYRKTGDEEET